MKVKATAKGYFGGVIRNEGDEFEMPDDTKVGSWFYPVEEQGEPEPKKSAPVKGGKSKHDDEPI